jgi:serine phosphatase RsbU (regulator of sigma subunit)
LAEEGAEVAGASFSNMAVLDAATYRVRAAHQSDLDPVVAARWSEFDLNDSTPLGEAMLTGIPVLIESLEQMRARYPHMMAETVAASLNATASFPLISTGGIMLGAAGFGWPTAQQFGVDQLQSLDLIVTLAAQALDRAVRNQIESESTSCRERADGLLLQGAFLPQELPHTDSLDVAAAYFPAAHAALGGDWYDVFPVPGGTCLVIGDVTGHGLDAAAFMGQLRNAVRAYAVEDPSPARVLTRLNQMMWRLAPGRYASAIVAVWDEERRELLRSNAGHPPVLRCRVGETGFLVPPSGRLLGVTPNWSYREELKVLRPGTTMLFYTDGLIEWRPQTVDSGMNMLLAFVADPDDLSPRVLCDRVIDWRRGIARLDDDVCVLAVRMK